MIEQAPKCPGCGKPMDRWPLALSGDEALWECSNLVCAWYSFDVPNRVATAPRHYEQEIERLRAALRVHGVHRLTCRSAGNMSAADLYDRGSRAGLALGPCTCGLADALLAKGGSE